LRCTDATSTRRRFLGSLGAFSATALIPARAAAAAASPGKMRGLAPAADYLFDPGLVYLNTGSLGPTPVPVLDRTVAAWKELERNPVFHGYSRATVAMDDVRSKAAAFINCKTTELVLTRCTTDSMNWVAQGLTWSAGDRVLTTDQEHPGGRVCWDYVARRHGVIVDEVQIPAGENDARAIVDRFAAAITPRTRVVAFAHLLSSTGLRMPVAQISALARPHGCIVVVDGAQAVGAIDVDVKDLGCHAYATSGHKWLLGPKGTGWLFLSEELGTTIDPIALQAGRASYSDSSGVGNIPGVLGLGAAIDYVSAIGKARIEAHNMALRNHLHAALQDVRQLRVVSAPAGPLASPLLTFALPDRIASRALYERLLDKHKAVVKMVPGQWLNGNRISTHLFNTERDVDALVRALKTELA
jgi:selenocysteine lyase/cysteine desulfurase